jgi:hypothetical protein
MPENTTPPPASPPPAPASATVPAKSYKGMAITSWILMVITCGIAIVPFIGFASWVIAFVVIPLVIIFAIVVLTRGGTAQGIILLIAAIVLMPGWLFLAPILSTAVWIGNEQTQEHQIVANLNAIDTAKTQWATETGAAAGAAVTMIDLTKYLGGTEVKAVVGETYDPHPVGEAPSAKLPASKSLAGHKAGEEITAASSSSVTSTSPSASPSPSASAEEEQE